MKLCSFILMVITIACLASSRDAYCAAMPVTVQKVTRHTLIETIHALGEVKASKDIRVASQFSGRIIHLNTVAGKYIQKNSLIATIRTKEAESLFSSGNRAIKDIRVFAPVSGFVTENFVFQGEIALAGQPLTRIISPDNTYISVAIPGIFLHKVKKNTLLTISNNDKNYETKIDTVIPVTNPVTGTFQANAPLHTSDLYPGSICQTTLHVAQKTVAAIPRQAILTRQGHKVVFVVKAEKAEKRIIQTGIRTDELIEITKGLQIGESVVIVGNYELSDGDDVRVEQQ